jgi:hypothetical protein
MGLVFCFLAAAPKTLLSRCFWSPRGPSPLFSDSLSQTRVLDLINLRGSVSDQAQLRTPLQMKLGLKLGPLPIKLDSLQS